MRPAARALLALAAVAPLTSSAVDVGGGKLSVNGNGSWAYQRTNQNLYLADSDGDYDAAMFDLLLSARPADDLVLSAQLGFDQEEVGLEWAFAEWRFADALRLRIGKVKQPLGNYMELQHVGTARPFFTLPSSVYGPTEVGAESLLRRRRHGRAPARRRLGTPVRRVRRRARDGGLRAVRGARARTRSRARSRGSRRRWSRTSSAAACRSRRPGASPSGCPATSGEWSGTRRGSSAFGADGLSALYRGDRLWVSVEAFLSGERGHRDAPPRPMRELAFFVTKHIQLAARYELPRTRSPGSTGARRSSATTRPASA